MPLEPEYLNTCITAINTEDISQVHPELSKLVKGLLTCYDYFFQWSNGKYSEWDGLSTQGVLGYVRNQRFQSWPSPEDMTEPLQHHSRDKTTAIHWSAGKEGTICHEKPSWLCHSGVSTWIKSNGENIEQVMKRSWKQHQFLLCSTCQLSPLKYRLSSLGTF